MKFQTITGFRDILPPESALWNRVERTAREVFSTYGYGEIRLPIFEPTALFARAIGAETDVVQKEMYVLEDHDLRDLAALRGQIVLRTPIYNDSEDAYKFYQKQVRDFHAGLGEALASGAAPRTAENAAVLGQLPAYLDDVHYGRTAPNETLFNAGVGMIRTDLLQVQLGDRITPRPEATASVVRAYIEHGMHLKPGNVKLYYIGPMFRRERPQKGRYRQFYQIGAELLGPSDHPALDAEVIQMLMAFFEKINLQGATLYLNSIGHNAPNCRPAYVEKLREDLRKVKDQLGPDSQRRIETNPLRVLDSKVREEQAIIEKLPHIDENLCDACREHYAELKRQLALRGITPRENWRLVRGLDYYMRTTFEITATGLGSQNAVCGGGRYDGLVELLGGPATTKGIGFAIGTDRLVLSLESNEPASKDVTVSVRGQSLRASVGNVQVFLAWFGAPTYSAAVALTRKMRELGIAVEMPAVEMKFGKALSLADRLGARYAVILGEEELAARQFAVKNLADGEQKKLSETDLLAYLQPGGKTP